MKRLSPATVLPPVDPSSPVTEHTLYRVAVGNGAIAYFTSTRNADQFAAALNETLNACLLSCNVLLAEVYPTWRLAWPYLDDPKRHAAAQLAITEAVTYMDRALQRRGGTDYVFYAWRDVTTAVAAVRDLVLQLRDLYATKGHGVDRFRMELFLQRANELHYKLKHYGSKEDAPNAVLVDPPKR